MVICFIALLVDTHAAMESANYRISQDETTLAGGGMESSNFAQAECAVYQLLAAGKSESVQFRNYTGIIYGAGLRITNQPASVTVVAGETATFEVQAEGADNISYQWHRVGIGPIEGAVDPQLDIVSAQESDEGYYICEITGNSSALWSGVAQLTVLGPPVILTQPHDTDVLEERTAIFNVVAMGDSELSYQWYDSAGPLTNSTRLLGCQSCALRILSISPQDAGTYYCVVGSQYGDTQTISVSLTVVDPATHPDGIRDHLLGTYTLPDDRLDTADQNDDGIIDVGDIEQLLSE